MTFLTRKSIVLAAIQAAAGTAAVLDGTAAMNVKNISSKPITTESADLDFIRPWLGNNQKLVTNFYQELDFEVALTGSGTPGEVPPWDPLIRACAFSATVSEGKSVVYAPISSTPERVTLQYFLDGLRHQMVDAVGTFTLDLTPKAVPTIKFHFIGNYEPVTDAAPPADVDFSAFITPQAVGADYTPHWSLHGFTGKLAAFTLDVANQLVYRNLIGGKGAELTDRKATGSATFELGTVLSKDWWDAVLKAQLGELSITHGTLAGNIIQIDSPSVQLSEPQYSDQDGIAQMQTALTLVPRAGNDELVITLR
ncbi:phage tail tube protein [Caballeronia sp. LjRoot31]|uniref:phage tail tube protein n=1 Tax=Caballeronia sp. LjRoot31 TaxID=3342324 RepID=UPI003ED08EB2